MLFFDGSLTGSVTTDGMAGKTYCRGVSHTPNTLFGCLLTSAYACVLANKIRRFARTN